MTGKIKQTKKVIATFDTETDPFEYGNVPKPFCAGFYDGTIYQQFWGKDCIEQFVKYIKTIETPMMIYAHNGGKFDFFFMLKHLSENLRIVNGRILQCWIGEHEFRDSYAILPVKLEDYQKSEIDYDKMKKSRREKYRQEILTYLKSDCVNLHELVIAFHEEFGDQLTIGGTAMKQLKSFHKFDAAHKSFDTEIRPFFYGGRNQCFESGIIDGPVEIRDVNSMYPYVMKNYEHPISTTFKTGNKITSKTNFACIEAWNYGALPMREKLGGLNFNAPYGRFYATIHEINAGLETGTLKINRVLFAYSFDRTATFAEFVDHFYGQRMLAEKNGDKLHKLFYKLILNSAYGKFAQNPTEYFDYILTQEVIPPKPWELAESNGEVMFWRRPSSKGAWYNVATAASITGAARAELLRGIAKADTPLYVDTDSIICKSLAIDAVDTKALGAWKLECRGDRVAIAGRKLYAVFSEGTCVKKAAKGAQITEKDIVQICKGEEVEFKSAAPKFKLSGNHLFVKRRLKMTAQNTGPNTTPRKRQAA